MTKAIKLEDKVFSKTNNKNTTCMIDPYVLINIGLTKIDSILSNL